MYRNINGQSQVTTAISPVYWTSKNLSVLVVNKISAGSQFQHEDILIRTPIIRK